MKSLTQILADRTFVTGLIALGLSALLFLGTMFSAGQNFDPFEGTFFIHYIIFVIYFIVVGVNNRKRTGRFFKFSAINHNIIILLLANVSAYSLNRSLSVFQHSTDGLSTFLVMLNVAMLGFCFRKTKSPDAINHAIVMVLSAGWLFNMYETFYTLPIYPIGFMAFWFFGIALHIFVPLWFVLCISKILSHFIKASNAYWKTIATGIAIPILFFGYVLVNWIGINQKIKANYHTQHAAYESNDLPDWAALSQTLKRNWITERALKSRIVYTAFDGHYDSMFDFGNFGFNERRKHDPFIAAASFFAGPIDLEHNQKIDLLKAVFNQRHKTERRLWSGDNLYTSDIVTNVQLFPAHRLAYTEKIIKIKNDLDQKFRWNTTQEAIYSFYLPEGSVITSASLWVEGEERPSFLTTKSKADSAYTTIVGRERRDPLLLHWREGNQISVRVFPCTPEEPRQFKIGITSPMKYSEGQLTYENIDFVGPDWAHAKESINIVSDAELEDFDASLRMKAKGTDWTYKGNYKSNWTLKMKAVPVSNNVFTFNGKSFIVEEQVEEMQALNTAAIYLDINRVWTKSELNEIWGLVKNKNVFVHTNRLERVTARNRKQLFKYLRRLNYSLFPLYEIPNPDQALLITKSANNTPTLSDLKHSAFAKQTNDFMQRSQSPVKLFSLNSELSPYLKMLKELRLFDYAAGDVEDLNSLLSQNVFPKSGEDAQTIAIDHANVFIRQKDKLGNQSIAPDHLMRLFAYNDLMKQLGRNYFQKEFITDELIGIAEEAHVVSPISSLIVLETQADYDRFDIKASKNSLKNASMKSSGAVPEPHEWMMIILALSFVLLVKSRSSIGK